VLGDEYRGSEYINTLFHVNFSRLPVPIRIVSLEKELCIDYAINHCKTVKSHNNGFIMKSLCIFFEISDSDSASLYRFKTEEKLFLEKEQEYAVCFCNLIMPKKIY